MERCNDQRVDDPLSTSIHPIDSEAGSTPRLLAPLAPSKLNQKPKLTAFPSSSGEPSPADLQTTLVSQVLVSNDDLGAHARDEMPGINDEEDDNDDDDYDEYLRWSLNPERHRKVSEKKRRDHALFQSWIKSNQSKVLDEASKMSKEQKPGSVAHLMKLESERFKIIQTPREYQIELFEKAKKKNTIVVLDTGSGKTLIAGLLLRHILEKEIEDRAAGKLKRIAFFLVRTPVNMEGPYLII